MTQTGLFLWSSFGGKKGRLSLQEKRNARQLQLASWFYSRNLHFHSLSLFPALPSSAVWAPLGRSQEKENRVRASAQSLPKWRRRRHSNRYTDRWVVSFIYIYHIYILCSVYTTKQDWHCVKRIWQKKELRIYAAGGEIDTGDRARLEYRHAVWKWGATNWLVLYMLAALRYYATDLLVPRATLLTDSQTYKQTDDLTDTCRLILVEGEREKES